jgi:hypothetical protein
LVANRLTAAWKQGRQGGGRGYDYPTKVTPASGVAVLVENVSPLPRANIAGGDMLTLITDGSPRPQVAVAAKIVTFLLNPGTSI